MRRHTGFGWLELGSGVLLILLGILVFVRPDLALNTLVFAYGLAAIVTGVAELILYIQLERYTGFGPVLALIFGILSVMAGIMLLVCPATGALILTVLFPLWFIARCISRLAHLRDLRFVAGDGIFYLTLAINIIGLVLGFLMFLNPLLTLTTVRYIATIYLILLGIDSLVMALSQIGRR